MRFRYLLPGLSLLLLSPVIAQQDNGNGSQAVLAPSLELLEFLADFGEIDEATFEMIEYHAERDLEKEAGGNADEQQKMPELTDEN